MLTVRYMVMAMMTTDIDMGPDPVKLMLAGDWHKNLRWALSMSDYAKENGVDTILQLGDMGFWPTQSGYNGYFDGIAERAADNDQRVFWLDGNHEHHDLLEPGMKQGPLQHLPRGFRWRWWDRDWMAVGGGVSVDKSWRVPGREWFPQETLTTEQVEYCCRDGNVDIIVAHDCPDKVVIPGIHYRDGHGDILSINPAGFPADAIAESEEHRAVMGVIVDAFVPQHFYHGHYHNAYCARHDNGVTVVQGLDMDDTTVERNSIILRKEYL